MILTSELKLLIYLTLDRIIEEIISLFKVKKETVIWVFYFTAKEVDKNIKSSLDEFMKWNSRGSSELNFFMYMQFDENWAASHEGFHIYWTFNKTRFDDYERLTHYVAARWTNLFNSSMGNNLLKLYFKINDYNEKIIS